HPALRDHPGAAGELVYEEVSLRRERGEPGGSDEVLRRFPEWAAPLRVLLDLRHVLEADPEPDYPGPGDRVGEYLLLSELGRGRTPTTRPSSPGSGPAWPTPSSSPTTGNWSTWT